MKWRAECNFVRACGLNGHELSQLSVKGIRWKDGKLYVFIRRFLIRDTLMADERFVPVVSCQEHAILHLITERHPDERVFTGYHIPLFRTLFTLRRQCAQAPYFSLAPDRKLPTPNKRHLASFDDYNKAAAMGVAKVIGSSHLNLELVVRFDICGRNSPAGHGQ